MERPKFKFSQKKQNEVQIAIIEEFVPRFTPECELLYVRDAAKKNPYGDVKTLEKLGIPIDQHRKFPDIVLYDKKKKWLFLIEAVTSQGPVSAKRILELEKVLKDYQSGKVFITAFPDFKELKRHVKDLARETDVWLVEAPEHMIHFDGEHFIEAR
ncbi:MAG: hypothetical protein GY754_24605 [bacterium]|nr:hypothetical protein [bacterium]